MSNSHNRHTGPPVGVVGYNSGVASHATRPRAVPPSSGPSRGAAENTGKVIGSYMLGKTIGEGTFGKVKIAVHAPSGERVAVKILEKSRIKDQADVRRVNREIKILKRARHTNVIQLYEVIDTSNAIYLIMESCDGGEMFDYIVRHRYVQEIQACKFFHQIIDGVEALHRSDITHRDLKPENLLLAQVAQPEGGLVVKIVDFGLSNTHEGNRLLTTACGSPCYAAPEMIAGHHYIGPIADMWSIGVILFALLCGYLPFEDPNTAQLYRKILSCQYKPAKWISAEARDLISKILEVDPTKRYTPAQIRMHPWYNIVPESAVPRDLAHAASSSEQFRRETLAAVERAGFDVQAVHDAVKSNMCNSLSALYYLFEKSLIHNRAAPLKGVPPLDPARAARQQQQPPTAVPPLQISHIQQLPRNAKPGSMPDRPVDESPSHLGSPKNDLGTAKELAGADASATLGGQPKKGSEIENIARPPRNPQPPPKIQLRPQLYLNRLAAPATAQPSKPVHGTSVHGTSVHGTSVHGTSVHGTSVRGGGQAEVGCAAISDAVSGQNTQKHDHLPEIENINISEVVASAPDVGKPSLALEAIEMERPVTRRSHLRTPGAMNRPSTVEKGEFDRPNDVTRAQENLNITEKEPLASIGNPSVTAAETVVPSALSADSMDHEVNARAPEAPKSSIPSGGRRGKNIVAPSIQKESSNTQSPGASSVGITNNSLQIDFGDLKGADELRGSERVAAAPQIQMSQKQKSKFLNFGARFVSSGGRAQAPSSAAAGPGPMNPKEQAALNRASANAGSIGPGAGALVI